MAIDYFLKIDGIKGESTDRAHAEQIDVLSWSWGESQSGGSATGGGAGAGKVQMEPLHFAAGTSSASPQLMLACASGKHYPSATLTCRKAGGESHDFLTFTFTDVLISAYRIVGPTDNSAVIGPLASNAIIGPNDSVGVVAPTDSVAMTFSKIEMTFIPQNADGQLGTPVTAGWDLKGNKKA